MEPRERILEAAQELFFKFGIKSVTMDDIAKHLGMSKKTIYQFYRDKDEIVLSLSQEDLKRHQDIIDNVVSNSKDAVHEIILMMDYVSDSFKKMNPNLLYDLQKYYPKAWQTFLSFKEKKMMEVVETNFAKGIEQGLYRADINSKILARLRIEQVEMAMNPVIFPPDKYDLSQVQVVLLDHFLYGILTLKGHKLINKYKQIEENE